MSSPGRWTLVLVILLAAGIVAIWPRSEPNDPADGPADSTTRESPAEFREEDAALAPLRRRAAMQPCPAPVPDVPAPAGPLAKVTVPCLGAPGEVNLGAALAGKATLLNLWASWCVPCREEMPVLAGYADRSGAIDVLGVDIQEKPSAALEFVAEIGVTYPSVYDPDETVQDALRAPPVLPVNYLVRPDGSVQRITDPLVFRSPDDVWAAVRVHLARHGRAGDLRGLHRAGRRAIPHTHPDRHIDRRGGHRRARRHGRRHGAGRRGHTGSTGRAFPAAGLAAGIAIALYLAGVRRLRRNGSPGHSGRRPVGSPGGCWSRGSPAAGSPATARRCSVPA